MLSSIKSIHIVGPYYLFLVLLRYILNDNLVTDRNTFVECYVPAKYSASRYENVSHHVHMCEELKFLKLLEF